MDYTKLLEKAIQQRNKSIAKDRVEAEDIYNVPSIAPSWDESDDTAPEKNTPLGSFQDRKEAMHERNKEFRTLDWENSPKSLKEAIDRKRAQQWYDEFNKYNEARTSQSPLGNRVDPLDLNPEFDDRRNAYHSQGKYTNPTIPWLGDENNPIPVEALTEALRRKQEWIRKNRPTTIEATKPTEHEI